MGAKKQSFQFSFIFWSESFLGMEDIESGLKIEIGQHLTPFWPKTVEIWQIELFCKFLAIF